MLASALSRSCCPRSIQSLFKLYPQVTNFSHCAALPLTSLDNHHHRSPWQAAESQANDASCKPVFGCLQRCGTSAGHNMHTDGSVVPNAKHCPQLRASPQILCKYWVNAGKCLRGDACQYRHVQPAQLPVLRKGWVAARYIAHCPEQCTACAMCDEHALAAAFPIGPMPFAFCLLLCPAPAQKYCSVSCSTMLSVTKAWAQQTDNRTCRQQ